MIDYEKLPPNTRVWIYQSNEPFSTQQIEELQPKLVDFVETWVSHNQALRAWGDILHQRFIVLMVDESQAGASGCSIDKSVEFIKKVEELTGAELFDRFNFAYQKGDEVLSASKEDFEQLFKDGAIDRETIVFNNLVKNKAEFEKGWKVPLGKSWHRNFV